MSRAALPFRVERPHAIGAREVCSALEVDPERGLDDAEVRARLEVVGPNALAEPPPKSALKAFLSQLADPLVMTLLAAAVIAVVVGATSDGDASWLARYGDAVAILLIVTLNAVLGFVQERRAETALKALSKLAAPHARLRREGRPEVVDAADVVPGDILELEAGDAVVADARLVSGHDVLSDESALTGESLPVEKSSELLVDAESVTADWTNMVLSGTTVVAGKALAVVVATGSRSELGHIGELLKSITADKTPLEERLERFGKIILKLCLALSALLMGWGLLRGGRTVPELLLEAVSLAVAAIPEGLPAITTITLALGMQRMAKRGAIVRRLPAVETLGAATVIASDKTGTLTQNEMMVREVALVDRALRVTGEGYEPQGQFLDADDEPLVDLPEKLVALLQTVTICNSASLHRDEEGTLTVVGDPTEAALLTLAGKAELTRTKLLESHPIELEIPFDSNRKRMTVVTRHHDDSVMAHVKGGVDVLLPRCNLSEEARARIHARAEEMARRALRVLAVCRRQLPPGSPREDHERELDLLGLVGMMDPPRQGVKEAVESCKRAGIRAVVITGDHALTATAIAQEVGLWEEGDEVVSGPELAALDDAELAARVEHIRVFARTTPEQKLRIVRAFKERRHVVAMTGDGVNDAAALREAHIGVAMGRGGTDVARQAANLVLADDNFATIVSAIREGRAIYRNIQKFIFFLLSANAGLVFAVFAVSFVPGWPPLTPLQILWINLVTNGAPALALGMDPPDPSSMDEPPRGVDQALLGRRDYLGIIFVGTVMGSCGVLLYVLAAGDAQSLLHARALAFSLLAFSALMHALSCRSPTASIGSMVPRVSKPLSIALMASAIVHLSALLIPPLRPVFRTFPMTGFEWLIMLGLAVMVIPAVEIAKALERTKRARHEAARASGSRVADS